MGVRDVANLALVSVGTVSRVLNNHPNVEDDLKRRVLRAATELGYVHHPRRTDRFLNIDGNPLIQDEYKLRQITFCCRDNIRSQLQSTEQSAYFAAVLHGAEAECRQHNLHLRYRTIEDKASELDHAIDALDKSKAEALLLVNFIDERLVEGLLKLGLPTVLIDHYFADLPLDVVMNDSYHGAYRAVQHLINKGHRKIAFVNGLKHYTIQCRFDAYRRALEENDIEFNSSRVISGDLTVESGIAAATEMVRRKLDCTAVFCVNDETAFGFIQQLAVYKIRVPDDLSIIGFDDVAAARFVTPPLTTIRADAPALGRVAVIKLLERANNPTIPVRQTTMRSELVERSSVRDLTL